MRKRKEGEKEREGEREGRREGEREGEEREGGGERETVAINNLLEGIHEKDEKRKHQKITERCREY